MTGTTLRHHSEELPSRRRAGFFMRAGRWLAIGFLLGVGLLGGLMFFSIMLRAACVSVHVGGFGG